MFIITIKGTHNNIHVIHHKLDQNHNDIIITSGLKFNLFHINFGSIIFHISISIQIKTDDKITSG